MTISVFREKGSGTRKLLEDKLIDNGINDLNVIGYIEDVEIIKKLVSLGIGLSFLSEKVVEDDVKNGMYKAYYIDKINLNRKFYFVYHNERQLSPLNETFKNFFMERINNIEAS